MSISFFETKLDVNDDKVIDANAEIHIGAGGQVKDKSAELVLRREGIDFRQETIKYESGNDLVTVAGPSLGAETGLKHTIKGGNLVAKGEFSAARVEGTLPVTEDIGLYGSANLNANTGVQIGADGFELNILGFGLTLGVGGKFKVNTPLGSAGLGTVPMTQTVTNTHTNTRTNTNVLYN